jgi:hypothetical protein
MFGRKAKVEEEITGTDIDTLNEQKRETVVSNIQSKLKELESEICDRNDYMNERDSLLYDSDYILTGVDIKEGFDISKYNVLPRAIDIHSSQVMGRGFNIVSKYDKEDPTLFPTGSVEEQNAKLKNIEKFTKAQNAKDIDLAVIKENGGMGLFKNMAYVASAYGTGIIKKWYDPDKDSVKLVSIESPQCFRAGWSDDNFRERDFDAMVYQISTDSANKKYSKYLPQGVDEFGSDELKEVNDAITKKTSRKMTTVVDFVGVMKGINDNEPFHALIVGGYLVSYETKEKYFPKYYIFPNKVKLRRPWGGSDLSDEAIDLNKSYIQKMSDYASLINKILFPSIIAKGFEEINIPKKEQRSVQVFPMGLDQDMQILQFQPGVYPYKDMISENKEALFRALSLGRVFMDDPTISFESSQALMTGMKPTIDVAEDKQVRWQETFVQLFEDILDDLKLNDNKLKDSLGDDYNLDIEWPSVLRKEDAGYNTMLFNDISRGLMSLPTYLEKKGYTDAGEEIDRIKSDMDDPIIGAILSANLQTVNQAQIMGQPLGQPPQQPTNAPLSPGQNQPGNQPASAPGSGAPAVSPQGNINTQQQNMGV